MIGPIKRPADTLTEEQTDVLRELLMLRNMWYGASHVSHKAAIVSLAWESLAAQPGAADSLPGWPSFRVPVVVIGGDQVTISDPSATNLSPGLLEPLAPHQACLIPGPLAPLAPHQACLIPGPLAPLAPHQTCLIPGPLAPLAPHQTCLIPGPLAPLAPHQTCLIPGPLALLVLRRWSSAQLCLQSTQALGADLRRGLAVGLLLGPQWVCCLTIGRPANPLNSVAPLFCPELFCPPGLLSRPPGLPPELLFTSGHLGRPPELCFPPDLLGLSGRPLGRLPELFCPLGLLVRPPELCRPLSLPSGHPPERCTIATKKKPPPSLFFCFNCGPSREDIPQDGNDSCKDTVSVHQVNTLQVRILS
ncbi:uncharacterized protein LOC123981522 [Micropterus dolomieu]|uniref:uncharacterized protein LOC123981522 n=1 Tax=Micropterus dolomieu TaxID=147949 RepID=UPI001E8DD808|nr:uncharacterized protein LOC123981522 [Micropterus dolomieu]